MKKFNFIFIVLLFSMSFILATDFGSDIEENNYKISRDKIERMIEPGMLFNDFIEIENMGVGKMDLKYSVTGTAADVVDIVNMTSEILPKTSEKVIFLIKGKEGSYEGIFRISGGIDLELPILINVTEKESNSPFLIEITPIKKKFDITNEITFQVNIRKLKKDSINGTAFKYVLYDSLNQSYILEEESLVLENSQNILKTFISPEEVSPGEFYLEVSANYNGYEVMDKAPFVLYRAFFDLVLFGFLPMWVLVLIISLILLTFLTIYIIKKRIESKKKYKMSIDLKTIPKKNKDFLFLGRIAETNHMTYYDPDNLTTHSIVAGATGGGKSITAQVFIEELLMKDVAVIVFDPTAQWSGMLRKCTDKKMMSFYPTYKLKPTDARAFKGNVRMIKNARQVIDLNKHINPGQIQIFSLNKLDPSEMDIFVASIIRQIFKSDPKEYPGLKVLLVFDEVHRLLPKFGGNGEGFLQIERACREFRKWGMGVMLVSQVLNDFVGSIKANISTEVQMRTRDEGDLKRIETKHGEIFLQSLVKASAGVGMFANPRYNHAKPYFINFRPILHNTRRLSDEELDQYNEYNDQVDSLEFQVEKLEEEKVDTFDLKMELKLIKDKIMSGSFSVVEIYLEGLIPRVAKEWEKLGKEAPKLEIELVSEEEIQAAIKEAKEKHDAEQAIEDAANEKEESSAIKVDITEKIVKSITFDNGVMISSLKEMTDYLPNMDEEVLALHVNEEKNDFIPWIKENFGDEEVKKLEGKISKDEILAALLTIGKDDEKKSDDSDSESKPDDEKIEEAEKE